MLQTTGGQRFTTRQDWRVDATTRQMAAFATLGFRVVIEQAWDDLSGTGRTIFHHSGKSTFEHRQNLPGMKRLMRMFRSGEMERVDPEHPLLDALAGIASYEALEGWRLRAETCCLAADAIPHGMGPLAARRARLIPGIPPPEDTATGHVDLASAANAAGLSRIGIPVLSLHSHGDRTIYRMAAVGVPLSDRPAVITAQIMQEAQEGRLSPDHPFLIARQAVLNFVQILTTCQAAIEHTVITWRNKKDRRSAALLASASSAAEDIAHRHMK